MQMGLEVIYAELSMYQWTKNLKYVNDDFKADSRFLWGAYLA